jgi:CRISPR-associated protein Cmr2
MPFDIWAEPHLLEKGDAYSRVQALTARLVTDKEGAKQDYLQLVHKRRSYDGMIREELARMQALGLATPQRPDKHSLPSSATFIQFRFTLARAYLSKDDEALHICDNPLRKDIVFKVPLVAATAWKGLLRWTMVRLMLESNDRLSDEAFACRRRQLTRLFGNEKDVEMDKAARLTAYLDEQRPAAASLYRQKLARITPSGFVAGRLQFYPTFFNQMDVEVINPHDRKTKAGTHPIYFECAPAGAEGTFSLLYVPFDRIDEDETETRREVADDLTLLAQGLRDMFTLYGFGAKTSSGFGLAEDRVKEGHIQTNVLEVVQQTSPPQEPVMPEVLQTFLQEFPDEDFSLKPNEWRKQRKATTSKRNQYKEARSAFQQYHQAREAYEAELAEWEAEAAAPVQSFFETGFESFSQLAEDTAKSLAAKLTTGGDA